MHLNKEATDIIVRYFTEVDLPTIQEGLRVFSNALTEAQQDIVLNVLFNELPKFIRSSLLGNGTVTIDVYRIIDQMFSVLNDAQRRALFIGMKMQLEAKLESERTKLESERTKLESEIQTIDKVDI